MELKGTLGRESVEPLSKVGEITVSELIGSASHSFKTKLLRIVVFLCVTASNLSPSLGGIGWQNGSWNFYPLKELLGNGTAGFHPESIATVAVKSLALETPLRILFAVFLPAGPGRPKEFDLELSGRVGRWLQGQCGTSRRRE